MNTKDSGAAAVTSKTEPSSLSVRSSVAGPERFFGEFKSVLDVKREFWERDYSKPDDACWPPEADAALDGAEILFACYEHGGYEGSAFVLFRKNGKLYEVSGGHCSCYGLEGQWSPEETSAEALARRDPDYSIRELGGEAVHAFCSAVAALKEAP